MAVIDIKNLSFGYTGKERVLNGLTMSVPEGSVYGFLGVNGAGKSTTIRTILGLLSPSEGQITVLGNKVKTKNSQYFKSVGSLIESPSLYPNLNAEDNLKVACLYHQIGFEKIPDLIEKVGLTSHKRKKSGNYSTGMKQRLGLAMALVHNPQLLILDEPTNGLDPKGINEIRRIILGLKEEGKTIMLSSHLLSEIEKISTHVGILNKGKLLFEGPMSELEALKSSDLMLKIRVGDTKDITDILQKYSFSVVNGHQINVQLNKKEDVPIVIRELVKYNVDLYEVSMIKNNLEDLFISMTD